MKNFKRVISIFITIIILGTLFTGCSSKKSASSNSQVKKPTQVSIGILNGLSSTSLIIASKKGFLKEEFGKEGIKVNEVWITSGGGPAIINAMESNNINIGGMADQPIIQAAANGGTEKVIGDFSQSDKYVELIVPKNSPANSIKDLKGKKISVSVGTVTHRILYAMLKANNMKPEDVQIVNSPDGNILPVLTSGNADAAVTSEPTPSKLELDGQVKVIGDTAGYKTNYAVLVATGEFIKEYPEEVKTLLRAVKRAIDYLNNPANHDEAVKILADATQVTPEVVEKALPKFSFDIDISDKAINSFQDSADMMYSMKIIRTPVKAKDIVDKSFLESLGYVKK
ncbi:MAG: aliphatic sulfonate ABC transporter substrate-binding protein [Clostridium sp.]|uniref:ABC transporter substrate-binding protein n=1 Tax=Clostridium sp. TaxID=1506 RepID=UPI0039ED02F6